MQVLPGYMWQICVCPEVGFLNTKNGGQGCWGAVGVNPAQMTSHSCYGVTNKTNNILSGKRHLTFLDNDIQQLSRTWPGTVVLSTVKFHLEEQILYVFISSMIK